MSDDHSLFFALANLGKTLDDAQLAHLQEIIDNDQSVKYDYHIMYIAACMRREATTAQFAKSIIYLIENYPEIGFWESAPYISELLSNAQFVKVQQAWEQKLRSDSNHDAQGNAGLFVYKRNWEAGQAYFELSLRLCDYKDNRRLFQICGAYYEKADCFQKNFDSKAARRCWELGDIFLSQYSVPYPPLIAMTLEKLMVVTYCLGDLAKANEYASKHIELTIDWSRQPKCGYSMQGLVALAKGETADAIKMLQKQFKYLLADELDLFLADILISRGHSKEVTEALRRAKKTSSFRQYDVAEWIDRLQNHQSVKLSKYDINASAHKLKAKSASIKKNKEKTSK